MGKKYTSKQLADMIKQKLSHNYGTTPELASDEIFYNATVLVLMDIMRDVKHSFRDEAKEKELKTVYYLSMEFLMGRSLKNNLFNMGLTDTMGKALASLGVRLDNLYEQEPDAGLGNGGLGRLAACFLDSLTSCGYPAYGYCIKYDFGIFSQKIINGWQTEMPDFWLPGGGVWLEARPGSAVDVYFDGYVRDWWDGNYHNVVHEGYNRVRAVPYDLMVAGNGGKAVNVLRLWSAEDPGFNMQAFNQGDYVRAMEQQAMTEAISKVLYPEDNHMEGKSLRLRQQYFLVSASIQDILQRHIKQYGSLENLHEKVAIHINDTHPSLAIPELMRYMLDECGYAWDDAMRIVEKTLAYTNHTVMSEALECWSVELFRARLPRVFQIVQEIDNRFRANVWERTHDADYVERTAIISNGVVRMANMCVACCHCVNGVSKLHSDILTDSVFKDYYNLTPEKFTNVTNGIAHRRWLCQANPALSDYLKETIGDGFVNDASQLERLMEFKGNKEVLDRLAEIKRGNKVRLANYISKNMGEIIDPDSIFDMQLKRLHEYKRQHLNALHIISDYLFLKENPNAEFAPKTYIFGAKAAPGYHMAKQIIQLIWHISKQIENDPAVCDKMKVIFMEDYKVTLAELLIPAADISEQISLASTEASGTGNMKFMLNGAVTLGTEDGANVEIHSAVGDENIIIFGMSTEEVKRLSGEGYQPMNYYYNNEKLKAAIDYLNTSIAGMSFPNIGQALTGNDRYMVMADFADYCAAQEKASALYRQKDIWSDMALVNIAKAGRFAADRSISDYANNIWNAKKI